MWRPMVAMLMTVTLAGCTNTGGSPSPSQLSPEAAALATQLRSSGLAVEAGGEIEQPFFSVKGQVLSSGTEQIQVFTFPDAESAVASAAKVSPDGATIGTTSVLWAAPPHFYRSGKLVALYVGRDERTMVALRAALGNPFAGAS